MGVKCVPLHPLSGTKPGGDKREFFEHDEIDRKDSSTRAAVRVAGFPVFRVRQGETRTVQSGAALPRRGWNEEASC